MNKLLIIATVALLAGFTLGRLADNLQSSEKQPVFVEDREISYWVAPMDPNYRRDKPGKSPMGMDLVPVFVDEAQRRSGTVSIDPVVINNLGVRTAPAQRGSLPRLVETVGYVSYDEQTLQHVHTRVDGWIETLAITSSGDPVKRGQLLFELYSPALVNAQQEFLAALASGNRPLRNASAARLAALGMTSDEIERLEKEKTVNQRVQIFAEADGVVAHLGVREGIFVTPATEVLSVANLDRVWVLAEVLERQSTWVSEGQQGLVTLDHLQSARLSGQVDYIYPELDPISRTLKVRLRFDNPDLTLRPNMFARVVIKGRQTGPLIHIPKEAVLRGGEGNRVVLALDDGSFQSVPVQLGVESGDRIAVRRGLAEGARVVVSGQFLIDSESNLNTALKRMSRNPSSTSKTPGPSS